MKKIKPIHARSLLLFFILLFSGFSSYATHIVGVDLSYTWVSGNTYKITVVAYGNCGSSAISTAFGTLDISTPYICVYDGNTLVGGLSLAIQPPSEGVEITPVCAADIALTQCTDPSYAIPGIKKFVYSGNYTVPYTSSVWRFMYLGYMGPSAGAAGRASAITNISSGTIIQLVDTLNNSVYHNSNPVLSVIPTPFFCLDNSDNYNPGAIDPDADSLSFFLVPGINSNGTPGVNSCTPGDAVSYIAPYTATAPLATSSFSFDEHTGQISFYPNTLQRALVVYNIEEYRNDTLIGTSQREMTFTVLTCTNTAATGGFSAATNGTIADSTHFKICQNAGAFTVHINPTEADTANNITVTAAGLPTGCTIVTTGNGTPTPHCTISWTSTGVTPGAYTFYLTYTDNNCPLNGVQTLAYTIDIVSPASLAYSVISPAGCVTKAALSIVPSGYGEPWKVDVSAAPGDTIQTFTPEFGTFTDSLFAGSYTFTIFNDYGCKTSIAATVAPPVAFTASGTFTNPSYCGSRDGTITLYHLYPGTTDTIKYYYNGVLQPSLVRVVAADSQVILTSLGAGIYSDITVSYGYCVSAPVGPFTLVNPPFTVRAITSVNPSWCGYCDGSIKIYGLHPAQLDTIYYTKDGAAQPPIYQLIGSDSTVSLTGLCQGTYNYFYAITGGGCVSNTLGPAVLAPPPFTMRSITFTNPSYCGICNGTITLHGLHPGQHDTINYTYNGVAQTPVAFTIGTDSTVTLTGLCAGVYGGFVASTAGVCISNTLGPVTLTVPPFTMRAISSTNPDYCGICNGTITLYGLHPGETDTISYTFDGVAATPLAFTIGTDSMVVLTGLCAGTYSNFVASTGGICVSNTLGPVTLTVPPFTMRSITYTNPAYCGICNGTITLHGLHPGEHDTITYTYNGVAATPVSYTIGTDSTVNLTGLCAGVYADFVANTGGVCVSNTLGPVTLTVPPFTIRALSFTNPFYCGICNGTITIYGLYPGETDTLTYTYNGAAAIPLVVTAGADSTTTLTGLCSGVYDNFIVRTGGVCVSNTLGPVTLTVPPFTIRAISYTNPTKCGFCDGTVTIYGVYPGETDTLNYTFNGVAQTAVVRVINADSTIVLSGLCEGTYGGFVVNTGGVCISNTLGPVTLVAPPIIPGFTYTLSQGCAGDTLRCINTSTPASDLTYTWTFGDGGTDTATNPVYVYHNPGTDSIILRITNTRCVASDTQIITLNNLIDGGFTDLPDSFVCQGSGVVFTNTSAGTSLTYVWNFGDGTTATTTNATHVYPNTGTYDVSLTVANYVPCYDTITKILEVDSSSGISILTTDTVICNGEAASFEGIYSPLGSTGVIWTFGDNNTTIQNTNPVLHAFGNAGLFTVTLEALYRACPDTTATRNIYVVPYPNVDLGGDTAICPGSVAITLADTHNATTAGASWLWSTGQTTSSIEIIEPGSYYVTVSVGGCQATDSILVKNDCYLDIPNAFTPNGDGVNDYFFPRQDLAKGMTSFHMSIFNRWGQVIFETSNTDGIGWDGRFNNAPQPEGVYIYMIDAQFQDGEKEHRQGNITLLR
jgi:gliding motility-associated-like protein